VLALLLTACGGGQEEDPAQAIQRQYAAVTAATMEADITCHYEDEERTYTLLCAYTPESSTVTVLAPENLTGISATVSEGKLELSYEDISLDAGSYSAASISPVSALPKLMEAASSGYVTEYSEETVGEREALRLACDLEDETLYTTWFDRETLLPLQSEISVDGEVVFAVAWTRFEVTGQREITEDIAS
jgi:outer membrane lipoprotein-sorting protein